MHNDFPLAPRSMIPKHWSQYMREVNEDKILKHFKVPKLAPNLHDKKNYVIHHRVLDTYLEKGLKLFKVHRVLKFKESASMKPYIRTQHRA